MTETAIDPGTWLKEQAADPSVSWSIGTFGALAEFMRGTGEAADIDTSRAVITVTTSRGALRFRVPPAARLIAYEGLSTLPAYWSHGVSLCLPAAEAALGGRGVMTLIGGDAEAVGRHERDDMLIDLGVGGPHIEACVRTGSARLLRDLEPCFGKPLFGGETTAPDLLKAAGPHRIFRSALARIEVYGPIPATGAVTEHGPHSHLLPDLLDRGRAHASTVPIPAGWLPALNLYPSNPARDGLGEPRPFDRARHDAFQRVIDAFGPRRLVAAKRQVEAAIRAGESPGGHVAFASREERTAVRVALRQLRFTDGPSDALDRWHAALEPSGRAASLDRS